MGARLIVPPREEGVISTGPNNKRRGYQLENEVVRMARTLGLPARRSWGSNGRSLGLHPEVDVVVGGVYLQCKRVKKLSVRFKPGDNVQGQVFREDRGIPYVMVPLSDYLGLLAKSGGKDD